MSQPPPSSQKASPDDESLPPADALVQGSADSQKVQGSSPAPGGWRPRKRSWWEIFPWKQTGLWLGALAAASLLLVLWFSSGNSAPGTVPEKAATTKDSVPTAMRPTENEASAPPQMTSEEVTLKQQLAETELSMKKYAEAEQDYRAILPFTNRRPLAGYQIFTCMVLQGHRQPAQDFLSQLDPESSPAVAYGDATLLFLDGQAEAAKKKLREARAAFPQLTNFYDPTLRAIGCEL